MEHDLVPRERDELERRAHEVREIQVRRNPIHLESAYVLAFTYGGPGCWSTPKLLRQN